MMPDSLRSVVFALEGATPTLNTIRLLHFFEYKRLREVTAWQVRAALSNVGYFAQAPMQRCKIVIARYSVGSPDADGVFGGLKILIDCLVMTSASHPNGLGVIVDDRPGCMSLVVQPHRVEHLSEQKTVVAIQELEALPEPVKKKRIYRKGAPSGSRVKQMHSTGYWRP